VSTVDKNGMASLVFTGSGALEKRRIRRVQVGKAVSLFTKQYVIGWIYKQEPIILNRSATPAKI